MLATEYRNQLHWLWLKRSESQTLELSKNIYFFLGIKADKLLIRDGPVDLKKKKKRVGGGCESSDASQILNCLRSPKHRGKYCLGERRRYRICNPEACPPGLPSFRDTQCRHFNAVPYKGRFFQWETIINRGHTQYTDVDVLILLWLNCWTHAPFHGHLQPPLVVS